ncbi:Aldo/keto reductase [Peniophora sp. CONT]|nr:Aldo/keto reductase [Peniophora sp. CONT]
MVSANTPVSLNDGNTIPWLGFGTGSALYTKDAEALVASAIKLGITHLDGAQAYANEDSLGSGLVSSGVPRSKLFVTTKLGKLSDGQSVRDAFVGSLKKLKLDYVDLFLIHNPIFFPGEGALKKIWKELEGLKKEGLAKSIGVSNSNISNLKEILDGATIVPAVNQVEFHAHDYEEFKPLLEFQAKHKIVTQSYGGLSPLFRVPNSPVVPVVTDIAAAKSKAIGRTVTNNQVLGLWLWAKGVVAITTSTKPERVSEYLAIEGVPALTDEEVAAIDAAGAKEHDRHFFKYEPSA